MNLARYRLLEGAKALALRRAGAVRRLSDLVGSVDSSEGRIRVVEHLEAEPYPHYELAPDHPGLLLRIEADGTRTLGRFVNREFRAAE